MTQQQTERDDALIAEARKNIEKICPALKDDTRTIAAEALRLERSGWTPPAKPDRYLVADEKALISEAIKRSRSDDIDRTKNQAVSFACSTLMTLIKEGWKPEVKPVDISFVGNCSPTHRCKVCGALWICRSDSWSLCSKECGKCCDNKPMLTQIEPLLHSDLVIWHEPSKPDRYVVAAREFLAAWGERVLAVDQGEYDGDKRFQAAAAVLRRHFEPPSEVVEAAKFYDAPGSRAGNILARFILSLQNGAPITGQPLALITDEQIKQITNRFLGWKLPEDFHPDDGISFEPEFNKEWNAKQGKPPQRRTPTGTNLFSYTQAEAMVRFILADFILKGDQ